MALFPVFLAAGCSLVCREARTSKGDKTIPLSELAEIKAEAIKTATGRYVVANTYIESHYKPPSSVPCPNAEQQKAGEPEPTPNPIRDKIFADVDRFLCEEAKKEIRVEAVSAIRGVQLTPLSRNKCMVKFDFVESPNPHAKLPPSTEAVAERFEAPTSHYWVVR